MIRTYTGPPNDVVALANALRRGRRFVPAGELVRAHRDAGGTLDAGAISAKLDDAGWTTVDDAWIPRTEVESRRSA